MNARASGSAAVLAGLALILFPLFVEWITRLILLRQNRKPV
ncbi:hypothetical protein AB0N64_06460 [Microbacterium sp. NPDC089318]